MSLKARKELCESIQDRYRNSRRREKKKILDEFSASTGYHRKHAIRKLGRKAVKKKAAPQPPRAPRLYTRDVQKALFIVWRAANCICAKRLVPCLPRITPADGDFQHSTHGRYRIVGLIHADHFVGGMLPVSRANQAAAFARISRSCFSL